MRSMWRSMRRFVRRLMGVVWNAVWNAHRCAQMYTCMVIFINMYKIASKLFVTQASSNLEAIFRHHFFTGSFFVKCVQLCMCNEFPRELRRLPKRHKKRLQEGFNSRSSEHPLSNQQDLRVKDILKNITAVLCSQITTT